MIKKPIILFFLFFINTHLIGQNGLQMFEQSKKLLKENKPKKALDAINKAIEKDGEKINYLDQKSEIGMFISPDVSFDAIQRMMQLYPDSVLTYERRATFYFLVMRDYDKCIDDLNRVLSMTNNDSIIYSAYNTRGTCHSYMGNTELALADIEKTIALRPLDYEILNNKALALHKLGRTTEAIETLKFITEKRPDSPYSFVNLGYIFQKTGQFQESIFYLKKSLEINPKVAFTWNNLGYSQFKNGQYNEAIKSIEKSLKLDPNNSYAFRNLALIAIEQKQLEKACKHVTSALSLKFTEMYGNEVLELRKKYCLQ